MTATLIIGCGKAGIATIGNVGSLLSEHGDWRDRFGSVAFLAVDADGDVIRKFAYSMSMLAWGDVRPVIGKLCILDGIRLVARENPQTASERLRDTWWESEFNVSAQTGDSASDASKGKCLSATSAYEAAWASLSLLDNQLGDVLMSIRSQTPGGDSSVRVILVASAAEGVGRGCWPLVAFKVRQFFNRYGICVSPECIFLDASCHNDGFEDLQEANQHKLNSLIGMSEISSWLGIAHGSVGYDFKIPSLIGPDIPQSTGGISVDSDELPFAKSPLASAAIVFGGNAMVGTKSSSANCDMVARGVLAKLSDAYRGWFVNCRTKPCHSFVSRTLRVDVEPIRECIVGEAKLRSLQMLLGKPGTTRGGSGPSLEEFVYHWHEGFVDRVRNLISWADIRPGSERFLGPYTEDTELMLFNELLDLDPLLGRGNRYFEESGKREAECLAKEVLAWIFDGHGVHGMNLRAVRLCISKLCGELDAKREKLESELSDDSFRARVLEFINCFKERFVQRTWLFMMPHVHKRCRSAVEHDIGDFKFEAVNNIFMKNVYQCELTALTEVARVVDKIVAAIESVNRGVEHAQLDGGYSCDSAFASEPSGSPERIRLLCDDGDWHCKTLMLQLKNGNVLGDFAIEENARHLFAMVNEAAFDIQRGLFANYKLECSLNAELDRIGRDAWVCNAERFSLENVLCGSVPCSLDAFREVKGWIGGGSLFHGLRDIVCAIASSCCSANGIIGRIPAEKSCVIMHVPPSFKTDDVPPRLQMELKDSAPGDMSFVLGDDYSISVYFEYEISCLSHLPSMDYWREPAMLSGLKLAEDPCANVKNTWKVDGSSCQCVEEGIDAAFVSPIFVRNKDLEKIRWRPWIDVISRALAPEVEAPKKYDVFISYRRDGGLDSARLLQQALSNRQYSVFFDYNSLRSGEFNKNIFMAIESAPNFILMLSEGALDRCGDAGDWVRKEIECARAYGCNIIPVATSRENRMIPDDLPPSLQFLKDIQISLFDKEDFFNPSVEKIINERFTRAAIAAGKTE